MQGSRHELKVRLHDAEGGLNGTAHLQEGIDDGEDAGERDFQRARRDCGFLEVSQAVVDGADFVVKVVALAAFGLVCCLDVGDCRCGGEEAEDGVYEHCRFLVRGGSEERGDGYYIPD